MVEHGPAHWFLRDDDFPIVDRCPLVRTRPDALPSCISDHVLQQYDMGCLGTVPVGVDEIPMLIQAGYSGLCYERSS